MPSGFAYLALCLSGNPRKLVLRIATDRRRLNAALAVPTPCPLARLLTWIRLSVLKYVCRMALLVSQIYRCFSRPLTASSPYLIRQRRENNTCFGGFEWSRRESCWNWCDAISGILRVPS